MIGFVTGGGYEDGNISSRQREANDETITRVLMVVFGGLVAWGFGYETIYGTHIDLSGRGFTGTVTGIAGLIAKIGLSGRVF